MTRALLVMICSAHVMWSSIAVAEQRLGWQAFPGAVGNALHAFRQTNHWAAEAMAENLDGDRLGRESTAGLPLNFDPTRHLFYVTHDLNGDGRLEVFLLFVWSALRGNRQAGGVVMVETRPGEWRIGCEISDWGDETHRGGIRLLDRLSHGWRNFRTSDGVYVWRPIAGQAGAMECTPTNPISTRQPGRPQPK